MIRGIFPFSGFLVMAALALPAPAASRQEATLAQDYHGAFPDVFTSQSDRVRLLVKQAQLEVSARLGLVQYQEGFQYPLEIRFADGAPAGVEHALAYVQMSQGGADFRQELVVNLAEAAHNPFDFDQVFYHEMTHAVLNDSIGGEASARVPHWVQEGLAQYVSGEGEPRIVRVTQHLRRSQVQVLLCDLNGPYSAQAYPQYYLAIQDLYEKHSSNAVQALVRDLIAGQDASHAVEDATGLSWDDFTSEVRIYSLKVLQAHAQPDFYY